MARRRNRKKYLDEGDNHERWLVSYADFVTLLFAFFVLMYSVSLVNNIKYEHLSDALEQAFTPKEVDKQVEIIPESTESAPTTIEPIILENQVTAEKRDLSEEILKERRMLQMISENFEDVLQPYIDDDLVNVKRNDFWIELEMNSQLLFVSGEAEFSEKAIPILKKISEMVRRMPNIINIEGHTDNVPIKTAEFASNWDLSSTRATNVVREFVNYGVSPKRLAAIGYGENHPVAENNSEQGRRQNRRVVLVLMSQAFARYGMNDDERANLLNFNRSSKEAPDL